MSPYSGYLSLLWKRHYKVKINKIKHSGIEKILNFNWKEYYLGMKKKLSTFKTRYCFGNYLFWKFNAILILRWNNFVIFLKHKHFNNKGKTTWYCVHARISQPEFLILFFKITIIFSNCIVFKEHLSISRISFFTLHVSS